MTVAEVAKSNKKTSFIQKLVNLFVPVLALALMIYYAVGLSDKLGEYVIEGVRISLYRVLPTALPFMILCDLYVSYGGAEKLTGLGRIFSYIFGMPASVVIAYITGNVCGFPIGVKATVDMYRAGELKKDDAEKLMAYSNNPSPAFVIGGVGVGMCDSASIGIVLYISILAAGLVLGIVFRRKQKFSKNTHFNPGQNYNFVNSVKSAGYAFISIASFIILFTVIGGAIRLFTSNKIILTLSGMLLEVTNGCVFFTESLQDNILNFAFLGFALGFGGLSVMLQSASFLTDTDLRITPYFFIKLLQGVLAALFCFLYFTFFGIG